MTTNFAEKLGLIKKSLDPTLVEILLDLAEGNIDRDQAVKTLDAAAIETDAITYTDTYWDDIVGSLVGRALSSTAGKVDYNWDNNSVTFNSGGNINTTNDCIIWNNQKPHAVKEASSFKLHMHWEQPDDSTYQITVKHRVQVNWSSKEEDWTTTVVDITAAGAFEYSSGTLNQISPLLEVDLTNAGLSATVQWRLARTDAVAGDIEATFIDCHAEFDGPGSASEYSKT